MTGEEHEVAGQRKAHATHRYTAFKGVLVPRDGSGPVVLRALEHVEPFFLPDGRLGCVVVRTLDLEQVASLPVGSLWDLVVSMKDIFAGDAVPGHEVSYGAVEVLHNRLPACGYRECSRANLVLVPHGP